eukprot:SAG31_NODE_5842_length_2301_cov_1.546776_2_plen_134_part_00
MQIVQNSTHLGTQQRQLCCGPRYAKWLKMRQRFYRFPCLTIAICSHWLVRLLMLTPAVMLAVQVFDTRGIIAGPEHKSTSNMQHFVNFVLGATGVRSIRSVLWSGQRRHRFVGACSCGQVQKMVETGPPSPEF